MFTTVGSVGHFSLPSQLFDVVPPINSFTHFSCFRSSKAFKRRLSRGDGRLVVVAFSGEKAEGFVDQEERIREDAKPNGDARDVRRSADWKAARAYKESGVIYEGKVEGFNTGGLLIRFFSLVGFLPFSLLSHSHSCKAPKRAIQDIAKDLVHSLLSVKVIQADEEDKQLIFSEKDALWSKYSGQVQEGDIFEAKVGSVEDYGAFIHLQFPDGFYHITGLVHFRGIMGFSTGCKGFLKRRR
ncbi:hypothetical protein QJS10_CPB04g01413 [Acorus calamus]|uniref:S1 motif domain-containing protein n=1 Tax=Acorus calamus TaxID=4465 RepID=A0AAV9F462_ACOCL|nr:hypothetical protein QJS10_CPB04g01413 [Acorus calamus]